MGIRRTHSRLKPPGPQGGKSEEMTLVYLPITKLCLTCYPSRIIYRTVSVCRWSSSANYYDAAQGWSLPEYNDSVIYINRQLERRPRHRDDVALLKQRGFWMDFTHLGDDGVYLFNPRRRTRRDPPSPMKKYWRSIRNAIIVHFKRLRPVKHF